MSLLRIRLPKQLARARHNPVSLSVMLEVIQLKFEAGRDELKEITPSYSIG